jgi:hypothetical protein
MADEWLAQFGPKRAIVRAWLAACRLPGQTPDDLLHRLAETVSRRLDWAPAKDTEALCNAVLLSLLHQRPQARQCAARFLEQPLRGWGGR